MAGEGEGESEIRPDWQAEERLKACPTKIGRSLPRVVERHFGIEIGVDQSSLRRPGLAGFRRAFFRPPVIWLESTKT